MRLQRQSNGTAVSLTPSHALGAGGEALVFPVPSEPQSVAKVYRRPTPEHWAKLRCMLANPPVDPMQAQGHVSIAWPVDLLQVPDGTRRVVGYLMPRAAGQHALIDFYNPVGRRKQCPLFNYLYLHRTARNLAAAVRAVHARGYVIGDVNEMNILVTDTALVTLVDTDSFQVRDGTTGSVYRCPVGRPEFTPPELQNRTFRDLDRTPQHDLFGLGVLIFQLLMEGTHPFAGVYTVEDDPPPYEARILHGHYPYGTRTVPYRPMPSAPPIELLPPSLRELFLRCFEEGHTTPSARPDAEVWIAALQASEDALLTCAQNEQHRYGRHLESCPWCARATRLGGRDPFPSHEAVESGRASAAAVSQSALPSVSRPVAPYPAPPDLGSPPPVVRAPQPQPARSPAVAIGLGAVALVVVVAGALLAGVGRGRGGATGTGPFGGGPNTVVALPSGARPASDPGSEARVESAAATSLLDEVAQSIDQFRNETLSESEAAEIRRTLKEKCARALEHADRAIGLDVNLAEGWVARVRGLRLSGESRSARAALLKALARFPTNADLKEQQRLLKGS